MNEFDFIREISKNIPKEAKNLSLGIDDDAAVIDGPGNTSWLVSTDILAEGVHFKREWASWSDIGKRTLLANISDIAAMGGVPRFYFVSISIPSDVSQDDLKSLFSGMNNAAEKYDIVLAGGDTTSSKEGLFLSITIIGSINKGFEVYRSGAQIGDSVYVTGLLGGSALGLVSLESDRSDESAVMRHLLPTPRVEFGKWLSENRIANSMIDISDGLISDMNHIADLSNVGYKIDGNSVPVDKNCKVNSLENAISSGEEYELLFTVSSEKEKIIIEANARQEFDCKISKIGEIIKSGERVVLDENGNKLGLQNTGFVHRVGSE